MLKKIVKKSLRKILEPLGFALVRQEVLNHFYHSGISHKPATLPEGAEAYLYSHNPQLLDLRERYKSFSPIFQAGSKWTDAFLKEKLVMAYFRGDNAYVWQWQGANNAASHYLTACYIQQMDHTGLLEKLAEDDYFGIYTFLWQGGKKLSRDLLDSVMEILFLEKELALSQKEGLRVLDIGAGYGRLAYRLCQALDNLEKVYAIDGIAESTFLCEYYLRFRGVDDRAVTVAVDQWEKELPKGEILLATNIHSFSECPLVAIEWWLDRLVDLEVPYLMIAPNLERGSEPELLSVEKDKSRLDFRPSIEKRGFRLKSLKPMYQEEALQLHGVSPTWYYLFERQSG